MIPAETLRIIGTARHRYDSGAEFAIRGVDMNDLFNLCERMSYSSIHGDELRDWQNRIALILQQATEL